MSKLTKAIVRKPGKNFADGISTSNLGKPSFELALDQHAAYREALKQCYIDVIVLEADERYPDGCFVEDTAVVTNEVAIITRPADPSRLGEEESILETMSKLKKIERITAPENLEGGDILRVEKNFYIGITKRTNVEGANQLAQLLSKYGYTATQVPVKDILHLKTGIAYLGDNNFIGVDELRGIAQGKNMIKVEQGEEYSANCLRVNDSLIIPKGFPKSKSQIVRLGYNIIELDMSEFRKMDGGLTCLSLLF
ncbi:MAG: arginine deiminase family protein [Bacteroidales bacterium]|jgi:dimethylargininase|nr:arginine deiminase family protein [Bacteroidales bacterium]MDD4673685.1 arginine deiminase family protein [Bacteroidales bacterium]MDY0349267.1 arginine deiminase family protein [Tenuifilaceae bacterium]